ncbi:MAG: acyl carrier protein [Lachnospiraceae bacterium]|nr:acyl carrier protein [Lachnospiraceae bacterium]
MDAILEDIKAIVCKNLSIIEIDIETPLYKKGIDSMNLLFILNEIENFFEIRVPDDELLISNFETIEQISKLVKTLKGEADGFAK